MEALPHSTGALATTTVARSVTLTPGPTDSHLPVQASLQSNISSRLAAAKPVRWIGQGELPSLPWQLPIRGLVLVLDLWGGVSATTLTLLALGLRCVVLTTDIDRDAAALADRNFSCIVRCPRVELITADMFSELCSKRDICCIIAGGGSPCQGNTSLNAHRQGIHDIRSWQPVELLRICEELHDSPACGSIPILSWIENVTSAPADITDVYNTMFRGPGLRIRAQRFGWTRRDRTFWGHGPRGSFINCADLEDPLDLGLQWSDEQATTRSAEIVWQNKKPFPAHVKLEGGFRMPTPPSEVVLQQGAGALYTFTQCFSHPNDGLVHVSLAAARRFERDGKAYPPMAYEADRALVRDQEARVPFIEEKAKMMCMPLALVLSDSTNKAQRTKAASLLGNSFHIPSLAAFFLYLVQLLPATAAPLPVLPNPYTTVFGHDRQSAAELPGIYHAANFTADLKHSFAAYSVPADVWDVVQQNLLQCDFITLQAYWIDTQYRQLAADVQGPQWTSTKARAESMAAMGLQRAAANSKRGLDHALPAGLGREDHIAAASALPSPFSHQLSTDDDTRFATRCMVAFGLSIQLLRSASIKVLLKLKAALWTPFEIGWCLA